VEEAEAYDHTEVETCHPVMSCLPGFILGVNVEECKKCGGEMRIGLATEQTWTTGMPDFPGELRGVTMSVGGPGKVVECLKCVECGYSVTI